MIKNKKKLGFTLVELLVVIAIIGILTIISLASYTSTQVKARDSVRKSDLDSMSKALMMYYSDTGSFPDVTSDQLFGNKNVGLTGSGGTVYMRETPKDPTNQGDYTYVYKVDSTLTKFNLFANLENKSDSECQQFNGKGIYIVDTNKDYCYGLSSPNTVIDPSQF